LSHVTEIGGVHIAPDLDVTGEELRRRAESSEVRRGDPAVEAAMIAAIDAKGCEPGLGFEPRAGRFTTRSSSPRRAASGA